MKYKRQLGMCIGLSALLGGSLAWSQDSTVTSRDGVTPVPAESESEYGTVPVSVEVDAESTPARTAERRSSPMEEIVVTAQKREENLQDVPLSVQAFSSEQLETRGVEDPTDLMRIVPGFVTTETIGFTSTFIRGLGTDAWAFADTSVANYIDGIYNPSATTANKDFGGVERIEVLKGPQGTLFGRNAIGGAVNVITKPLSLDHPDASASLSYKDYGAKKISANASVPLFDSLALGLAGIYEDAGNYIDGRIGTRELPDNIEKSYRAKVRWQPSSAFELNLSAYRVSTTGLGSGFVVNTAPSLLGSAVLISPQDPYNGRVNDAPSEGGFNERLYSGQATIYTDWFDIKLLGAKQTTEAIQGVDYDGSPLPTAYLEVDPNINDVKTAEIQIVSNDTSRGADSLAWIVGAYYYKNHSGYKSAKARVAQTELDGAATLLGISLPQGLVDTYAFLNNLPVPTGTVGFTGLLNSESISGYAQATYDFTDWASLTLGGRYQVEKKDLDESTAYVRLFDDSRLLIPGQNYSCERQSIYCSEHKEFSPKVTMDFHLADETLLYLSWQKAAKSQTFNPVNLYDKPEYIPPEKISAYEAGVKTMLLDRNLMLNASAFYYDIKDNQVQFISLLSGGAITFESAKGAEVKGAEFDLRAQVFPSIIEALSVTASGTVLDAQYTEFKNASGFDPATGIISPQNNDFSGNHIVRSPDFSGSVAVSKIFYVPIGEVEVSTDYYYNSGFYFLAENQRGDLQPSYGLLGARIALAVDELDLRCSVFGNNLTNTKYYYTRLHTDFGVNDAVAPKATYGIQLSWALK